MMGIDVDLNKTHIGNSKTHKWKADISHNGNYSTNPSVVTLNGNHLIPTYFFFSGYLRFFSVIPNCFLAIESGPSHEGHEYADGFEKMRMWKRNDDKEFLPLVCRHIKECLTL